MKKTKFFRYTAVLSIIAGFQFSCNCPKTNEHHGSAGAENSALYRNLPTIRSGNEVKLNLCGAIVEFAEAEPNYDAVYTTFYAVNLTTPIDPLMETIQEGHLDALQAETAAQHPANHGCGGFVTGLKVFFGMEERNIRLLYVPTYFCRIGTSTDWVPHPLSSNYLVYSESQGFQDASTSQEGWIITYKNNIRILENGATVPREFENNDDVTGDTKAVFITFQGLKAVMNNNNRDAVIFWNYKGHVNTLTNPTRHTLIVSSDNMRPTFEKDSTATKQVWLLSNFANRLADRSHLCPPSCNIVDFVPAVAGQDDCQE